VIVLAVLAGGMLGAPARYLADRMIQARHDSVFPWGTFAVNMAGSAVLGFLLGAQSHLGLPAAVFALVGTGFCGGLTTFSTFGYETLRLLEDGALGEAGVNVVGSLATAVLLAWLGFRLAIALLSGHRGLRVNAVFPVTAGVSAVPSRPSALVPSANPAGLARRVECRGSSAHQPGATPARRPDCQHSQRGRSRRPAVPAA
jgi:fluoride exporter